MAGKTGEWKAGVTLRMHPEPKWNVQDPVGLEDSSAGLARGCKVRVKAESHHRPSRRCRTRGNLGTHGRRGRKVRDSRKLEDHIRWRGGRSEDWGRPRHSPSTEPEGAGFEATRRPHLKARRTERGLGATPALTVNRAGRCWIRGDSETPSEGAEDGARIGGNPGTHRQPSRKVRGSGKLGASL